MVVHIIKVHKPNIKESLKTSFIRFSEEEKSFLLTLFERSGIRTVFIEPMITIGKKTIAMAIELNFPIMERATDSLKPAAMSLLGTISAEVVDRMFVIIPFTHKGTEIERTL